MTAIVSVPVISIRNTFPYLQRFYEFAYWHIQRYVEFTCDMDDDKRMTLLPQFWLHRNLDQFPDALDILFDLPYYDALERLRKKYDFVREHDVIFTALLLAPLMHSFFYPDTDREAILMNAAERQEVLRMYEFMQNSQKDGFDPTQKYLLSYGGCSSVSIPNSCNWLMRMIEREYRNHYDMLGNPPRRKGSLDNDLPKRRPDFSNFLGYNTLLFLRDILHVKPFVPQELCMFIVDYLAVCHAILSKQDMSYKSTYDMLQNCKKTYGVYPIPFSYVQM